MLLDFQITQFYRLIADDLVLMLDTYRFYRQFKPSKRAVKEYLEILATVTDSESQSLEEVNLGKLTPSDSKESVSYLAFDYFRTVLLRFVCDYLAQYPLWYAKVIVSTNSTYIGIPVVRQYIDHVVSHLASMNLRPLYTGSIPYIVAAFISNYSAIVDSTRKFTLALISKIPTPPKSKTSENDIAAVSAIKAPPSALKSEGRASKKRKSLRTIQRQNPWSVTNILSRASHAIVVTTLSHPFLVITIKMTKGLIPGGNALNWFHAYLQILRYEGISGLYSGWRTNIAINLLPFSFFFYSGVSDSIILRRMIGQGTFDSTGGLLSVAREVAVHDRNGSALSLLNYGLLTVAQIVPGFCIFLTMRAGSWLLLGPTIHRQHQLQRRKEIVEACVTRIASSPGKATGKGDEKSQFSPAKPTFLPPGV